MHCWDDMVRLGASLERIPVEHKVEIGNWLVEQLGRSGAAARDTWTLWAIGSIGARTPFYGSAHGVVPVETAAAWLDTLLTLDWKLVDGAATAAANLSRLCGDRARDLPLEVRQQVIARLEAIHSPRAGSHGFAMLCHSTRRANADVRRSAAARPEAD